MTEAFLIFDWGRELVDPVDDLIYVCRDGRIAYINSAGARMLGGDDKIILGHPFAVFLHRDYADSIDLDMLTEEPLSVPVMLVWGRRVVSCQPKSRSAIATPEPFWCGRVILLPFCGSSRPCPGGPKS
ncbi:MAG: GGDEF/PAS/PAC-domain containing protein [Rhodospirillaceae bacterium]|nr:MAG: GGDEF/PAS/PAC-domain containing protein [Rhodospirillaceae bacterium]